MPRSRVRFLTQFAALVASLAAGVGAWACATPVFRFALERWQPDLYEVVLYHRGELSSKQTEIAAWLEASAADGPAASNYYVKRVDLAGEVDDIDRATWSALDSEASPWLLIRCPRGITGHMPIWSGPLTAETARAVVDSPARREIARRMADGASAVWLLLESGDTDADDQAQALLEAESAKFAESFRLPPEAIQAMASPVRSVEELEDLKVRFDVVRVSRDSPAEAVLVHMLLAVEEGLDEFDEPMAFPVFGRGRALYALVGKGINAGNILETCAFLAGGCQCEVKAQNPGSDLLMVADWDAAIVGEWVRPALATLLGETPQTQGGSLTDEVEAEAERAGVASRLWRNTAIALACLTVGLLAAVGVLLRRRKPLP